MDIIWVAQPAQEYCIKVMNIVLDLLHGSMDQIHGAAYQDQ